MSRLMIRVLDGFSVTLDGEPIGRFPTERVRALLLLLAVQPTLTVDRAHAASLLWSEVDDAAARRNLRRCLSRLRKLLGAAADDIVTATRQQIGLISAHSDYQQFQQAIRPQGDVSPFPFIHDELAAGFYLKNSPLFNDWLADQRAALVRQRADLLRRTLADPSLSSAEKVRHAEMLQTLDPHDELAQRTLLRALDKPAILHHFPAQVTPFIGRKSERTRLLDRLHDCRMVTILGAGGVGKTRLAQDAARGTTRAQFPDGVYFVPLVTARTEREAIAEIHRTLALPSQGEDMLTQLIDHLRDRQLLLVLDNVEQLSGKLGFLSRLLYQVDGVKLLVTSRDVVGIAAENRYPLAGLTNLHEASDLLWNAIRRITPDFELTPTNMAIGAKICEQLHGVPLALELAATWINTLDLDHIRAEIDHAYSFLESSLLDTPARHRSLGAIFDHSWQLQTPEQQKILAHAAIFEGGFDVAAARNVLGASVHDLRRLVEQSLLSQERQAGRKPRYSLHQLVREFSAEKIENPYPIRQAHAAHYLALVADLEQQLISLDARAASAIIAADLPNVTAAWRWQVAQNETAPLCAAVTALTHFFQLTGRYAQGIRLFGETIAAFDDDGDDWLIARLHHGCATFRMWQAQHDASLKSAEAAHRIAQANGDQPLIAASLSGWGRALRAKGRFIEAIPKLHQGLAACAGGDTPATEAEILTNLAEMTAFAVSPYEAAKSAEKAVALAQQSGNKIIEAHAVNILALVRSQTFHLTDSLRLSNEGLAMSQKIGNPHDESLAFSMRGRAYSRLGYFAQASDDFQTAIDLCYAIDNKLAEILAKTSLVMSLVLRESFADVLALSDETFALAERQGMAFYMGVMLWARGVTLSASGEWEMAADALNRLEKLAKARMLPYFMQHWARFQLSHIALCCGANANAQALISAFVDELLADPICIYGETEHIVIGYHVLTANDDPRARLLLEHGHKRIMRHLSYITDDAHKRAYCERIPKNQRLQNLYRNVCLS